MTTSRIRLPRALRRPAPLLAIVLTAATVVVLVLALLDLPRDHVTADPAAEQAAQTEAINFFTLDYRHIDTQIAAVRKLATGAFATQYAAKASEVKRGVVQARLSATATVADGSVAVEYQAENTSIVLVAVDSTTTTPASGKAKASTKTSRYRMRLTTQRVRGSWLVSSIEQVG